MNSRPPILLAFLLAVAGSGSVEGQRIPATGSWVIVPSPNGGPEDTGNVLLGVAALSPTDAWAVGVRPDPSQALTEPLAMHWDGAEWSIVATPAVPKPTARLNSIAAVSGGNVWAAGYWDDPSCICGHTLIERWDGTAWRRVQTPDPGLGNYLAGIAAASAGDIWAVGYQWIDHDRWKPLLLHYDGAGWVNYNLPGLLYGQLTSVHARAHDDIWAVGWIGTKPNIQGLALHWDGTAWKRVPFPGEPGGWIVLRGVSGVAPDDVWAVGVYQFLNLNGHVESRARSFHWDGTSWTPVIVGFAFESVLYAVDAVAADDVWAVGWGYLGDDLAFKYATMHWDGTGWSYVQNPNEGVLYAVDASSSSDAWAVGFGFVTPGTHTLRYTVP